MRCQEETEQDHWVQAQGREEQEAIAPDTRNRDLCILARD